MDQGLLGGASALVSAAIWAFSSTMMTAPARLYGGRATNLFKSTIGASFFLLTVVLWLGFSAFDLSWPVYARFIGSGVLGLAIADTAYLTSLKHIGPTLTAIVYQTSGIFTAVIGFVFLGETLTVHEAAGIVLVIGGVMLAVLGDAPVSAEPVQRGRGAVYALIAAAFHAMGVVLNKAGFRELEAWRGLTGPRAAMLAGCLRMTTAAFALLILAVAGGSFARQTRVLREPAGWRAVFVPAFLGTFVAMITMQISIGLLKSGVASVLLSMTPIFTIPVAWWLLGHRPTARSIGGALIALGGAYLLAKGK
jgi:drug/metabolite transporter (DMT)-like permease